MCSLTTAVPQNVVYGETTHSQVPRVGPRPWVHVLPCEASRSANLKMGEGRSDRNLYAQEGAARRRNQGVDRASAPTLGSKCRDLPGREEKGGGPAGDRGRGRGGTPAGGRGGGSGVGPPGHGGPGLRTGESGSRNTLTDKPEWKARGGTTPRGGLETGSQRDRRKRCSRGTIPRDRVGEWGRQTGRGDRQKGGVRARIWTVPCPGQGGGRRAKGRVEPGGMRGCPPVGRPQEGPGPRNPPARCRCVCVCPTEGRPTEGPGPGGLPALCR